MLRKNTAISKLYVQEGALFRHVKDWTCGKDYNHQLKKQSSLKKTLVKKEFKNFREIFGNLSGKAEEKWCHGLQSCKNLQ